MNELIAQLDSWLKMHRVEYYKKLNSPATTEQLAELEKAAGTVIPGDLRLLLKWKNGQPFDCVDSFHPLTSEMFISSTYMVKHMEMMNELLKFGEIRIWESTWAPFMDNGNEMTSIDLKSGAIIFRDHETEETTKTHNNIVEWLEELVQELSTNNFEEWDFLDCQDTY